jgi:hypothetical protein
MNLKTYASVLYFLLFSVTLYIIHKLIFNFYGIELKADQFYYSLEFLYAFFTGMGVLIILALIMVFQNFQEFVGIAFLAVTTINMLFSYIVVRPILAKTTENIKVEKVNFFVIFLLFLVIEMVLTAKMLNNSYKNDENSKIK